MTQVRTCLWYDGTGEDAARFYVSLLPDSHIEETFGGAPPIIVNFQLAGVPYQALNGGPMHGHSPAASISVTVEDQAEVDRLWEALTAEGGQESRCGWCVDRFGLSWQVIPKRLPEFIGGPDREAAGRATQAMFTMSKIDIAEIERAYRGG